MSLQQAMAAPLARVYLIQGDEQLLVERAESALVERALEGVMKAFNHGVWRAGEDGAGDCLAVARTLPMMSPRRVIVLRDIHEASPELLGELVELLERVPETLTLVLSGRGFPRALTKPGKAVEQGVASSGFVLRFKSRDQDPVGFAQATARELGCRLDQEDAQVLVQTVGKDLSRIRRELEKAALFVGEGGHIDGGVLSTVCSLLAEAEIWSLTEAIVYRDQDKALSTAHRLLEAGKSGETHRLLSMVTWQVRRILRFQDSLHFGGDPGFKMPAWKARNLTAELRRHPLDPADILDKLAKANHAMNSHRAGSRRIFEGLLLELVSR
jgi:DNA polymerase-3 subunit delta